MTKIQNKKKYHILILNSHPIQYFGPLYKYLNASSEIKVTALYCSDFSLRGGKDPGFEKAVRWDIDLLSGYDNAYLGKNAKTRTPTGFWSLICPEVWREVRSVQYDAILIHGHNYAVNLLALIAAKTKGIYVMMRCETHLGLKRSRFKKIIRKPIMNLLYHFCDCCLAIGTANKEFYKAMGVPDSKIFMVPYTIDNDRFITASDLSSVERKRCREKFDIQSDFPILLYASKFSRRKHPEDVLYAAAELQSRGFEFSVLMVGSGEMQIELKQLNRVLGLKNVYFPGFINQSELPRLYGACDIFILPSENEPWGLVVNEVMCASLPVVVAVDVGCVPDLVKHGENGYVYKTGDIKELVDALYSLLTKRELRKQMGRKSLEQIKCWSFNECLTGLLEALDHLKKSTT